MEAGNEGNVCEVVLPSHGALGQFVDAFLQLGDGNDRHDPNSEKDQDVENGDDQPKTAPEHRDDEAARRSRRQAHAGAFVVDPGAESDPEEAYPIQIEERDEHESDGFAGAGIVGSALGKIAVDQTIINGRKRSDED